MARASIARHLLSNESQMGIPFAVNSSYGAMHIHIIAERLSARHLIAERLSARHLILQHALGRCKFVRHAPYLSVTLLALLSVTLFYACAKGWRGRDTRVHAFVGVRESTPDQTPGPSRARWMEGGGTVRLHHQRQLGLLTARGVCMRTLRIPSIH